MTGAVPAELARLGPSFALDSHRAGTALPEGWRPLQELLWQPVLTARVTATRAALAQASGRQPADVEVRVAASLTQLGLAARLICPPLALAVLTGRLPRMDPAGMRWQPGSGGAVALSVPDDALAPPGSPPLDPAALAGGLAHDVLDGPVRALVTAAGTQSAVSPQVLWGNVASVVSSARAQIAAAEPAKAGLADEIVRALLDLPPLRGTHQGSAAAGFRRRSCCLLYRLAPGQTPVCGDCVLTDRSG